VVAVHGFPLDWNLWPLSAWPDKIAEIKTVTDKPVWVTEVGVSSFGAEEVQVFGLERTAELLKDVVPRIFWYSLFDLPQSWGAETRHREAEGSSYYRHFYLGLIREDGTPKPALDVYARYAEQVGLMQWFHFHDPRLDEAVQWMKRLGTRRIRTGLSWADSFRPGAIDWFDRQMEALADFEVTVTFCFTPQHLGVEPHHTSPAKDPQAFADFCAWMVDRYAPAQPQRIEAPAVPIADWQEPELNPLNFNRDERLAAERSAA
jgi:beta-xylosidase